MDQGRRVVRPHGQGDGGRRGGVERRALLREARHEEGDVERQRPAREDGYRHVSDRARRRRVPVRPQPELDRLSLRCRLATGRAACRREALLPAVRRDRLRIQRRRDLQRARRPGPRCGRARGARLLRRPPGADRPVPLPRDPAVPDEGRAGESSLAPRRLRARRVPDLRLPRRRRQADDRRPAGRVPRAHRHRRPGRQAGADLPLPRHARVPVHARVLPRDACLR